jgi:hypothetical protein
MRDFDVARYHAKMQYPNRVKNGETYIVLADIRCQKMISESFPNSLYVDSN